MILVTRGQLYVVTRWELTYYSLSVAAAQSFSVSVCLSACLHAFKWHTRPPASQPACQQLTKYHVPPPAAQQPPKRLEEGMKKASRPYAPCAAIILLLLLLFRQVVLSAAVPHSKQGVVWLLGEQKSHKRNL